MLSRFIAVILAVALSLVTVSASVAGIDDVYIKPTGKISWSDTFKRLYNRDEFDKSYALLIGVGNYDKHEKLSAPATDVVRVRNFLRDEANFDHIITLSDENAPYERINRLIEQELPQMIGSRDRFLFYFSGHGDTRTLADRDKRGYLVLKSSAQKAWHEMIDMPRLLQWAQNLGNARHVLFILDSCFSGLVSASQSMNAEYRDQAIQRLIKPGHHILTAGTEGEKSYSFGGESLFTKAFLSAARGGSDYSRDSIISLSEMKVHIDAMIDQKRKELRERVPIMSPHRWDVRRQNNAGEFFFLPNSLFVNLSNAPNDDISNGSRSEIQTKGIIELSQAAKQAFERGDTYRQKGEHDRAITDLNEAIRLDPKFAFAYGSRGEAYRQKDEHDRAIADLNEAIRLDPKYAFAYSSRGQVYLGKRNYDQAIADFDEAIRLDPKSTWIRTEREEAYRRKYATR